MYITATRRHMLDRVRQVGRNYYRAIRPAIVRHDRTTYTLDNASLGWAAAAELARRWRETVRTDRPAPTSRRLLGDWLKHFLETIGISQRFDDATGERPRSPGCGCAERQQAMNNLHLAFLNLLDQLRRIVTTRRPTSDAEN